MSFLNVEFCDRFWLQSSAFYGLIVTCNKYLNIAIDNLCQNFLKLFFIFSKLYLFYKFYQLISNLSYYKKILQIKFFIDIVLKY